MWKGYQTRKILSHHLQLLKAEEGEYNGQHDDNDSDDNINDEDYSENENDDDDLLR